MVLVNIQRKTIESLFKSLTKEKKTINLPNKEKFTNNLQLTGRKMVMEHLKQDNLIKFKEL